VAEPTASDAPTTRTTADTDKLLEEARTRWKRCSEAESNQRERILAAKKFRALDQWPAAIKTAREGGAAIAGQPPQPPRPCLVVDRLSQPVRQASNTIKNADFGFDVLPNGDGADDETADILKGYLRRVQNLARSESPIEWAADGAIEGGIGWFRILTDYVFDTWGTDTPTEALFDQELRLGRITNNLSVYCDPSAMRPTRSDAQFMLVTEDMDRDEFERRWPDADTRGLAEFQSTGDADGWVGDKIVRVAEYWRVTHKDRSFVWLKDGSIREGAAKKGDPAVRMTRVMRVPTVKMSKITACEVLEDYDWLGSRIPLIPIIGEELNVDGKPVLRGIIEMGMDAQRMVNYTYSAGIEIFALAGRKTPMVVAEAVANYKDIWQTRTIYSHSYLPFDAWDQQGRALPPPTLDTTEAPIQAAVALMRTSEDAIKASTSTGDASLGNTNPNERSGRALQALQAQSDLANSNYPDNVRRAIIYAAELMLEIIPKMTRPGQIWHILGKDDEPQQVMMGVPHLPAQGKQGTPQAAPGVSPEMAKDPQTLYKFYDPTAGKYAVTVTVGKATATKREEGAAALGELLPHLPPEMQVKIIPDYIKQLSFPGAQGIAEKLAPPADGEGGIPPQAQQMIQQMQQQLQQAQQMIQTDQVKQQATMQTAQLKEQGEMQRAHISADVELRKAQMDNATRIEVARIAAAKQMASMQAEAQEERLATGLSIQAEAASQQAAQAHEAGMAAMGAQASTEAQQRDHAAAAQGQQADQAHAAAMQADAQRAAQEQAAQQAAQAGPESEA
jgi:hypothetical protein